MRVCLYRNIRQTGHGCGAIKLLLDSEASLGVVDIIGEVEPGLDVPIIFICSVIEAVSDAIRVVMPPKDKKVPDINLEKLQKNKVNFQVHCGIDFGTAGTGLWFIANII